MSGRRSEGKFSSDIGFAFMYAAQPEGDTSLRKAIEPIVTSAEEKSYLSSFLRWIWLEIKGVGRKN